MKDVFEIDQVQLGELSNSSFVKADLVTRYEKPGILLLHITPVRHFPNAFAEPIGIETLAGTLLKNNIPINISLGVVRDPSGIKDALQALRETDYQYVGLGMPIGALEDALVIVEQVNVINAERKIAEKPPIQLLMGGNLPTNLPEEYLTELVTDFPFITVVRGWGDRPLVTLLKADFTGNIITARASIPGLVWKDADGVYINRLDPRQNQEITGRPVRVFVDDKTQALIEGSRDCSHPFCTFCARMPYPFKEAWKPGATEAIIGQMEDLSQLGITKATFTDEEALGTTVTHAVAHAIPLAQAIQEAKKTGRVHPDFMFAFSTRSDSVVGLRDAGRLDVLEELRNVGLSRIFLGIESGIPHDFKRWDSLDIPPQGRRYGKGITTQQHITAVQTLRNIGIGIEIGFINFDPLMDLGEVAENARFLLDNDLAKYTSEVINHLRLKTGARYTQLMDHVLNKLVQDGQLSAKPHLFAEFDLSTLHLGYTYLHPLVGKIFNISSSVSGEANFAMYTLKSFYRSKFITGEPTDCEGFDTLTALRVNNLRLLLGIVNTAEDLLAQQNIPLPEYDRLTVDLDGNPRIQEVIGTYRTDRNLIWERFLATDMPDYLREAILKDLPTVVP